jgi:serine/threonine-protein kinase
MGEVWAATHSITRRRVAMKFLKRSAAERPEMHQRFLREARAVSLVRHPNVVDVLDVFELEEGVPVMVMELLLGETLRAKLARDGALPVAQVASLVLPVVEGVEAAHAQGIIHRDLKPENIFLESAQNGHAFVKVLDFGIAKLTAKEGDAAETGSITETGSILGTPWYMAPEQLGGEMDIDLRADVWALGVILYECLCGRRPVEGSSVAQLVMRLFRESITPIEERVPGVAPELARLVGRMLERQRDDRPHHLVVVRRVLAGLAGSDASESARPMAPIATTSQSERPPEIAPGEAQKPSAPWDTGVPHAVPGRSRVSRSLGSFRAPAVLVAIVGAGAFTWVVTRSPSRLTSQPASERPLALPVGLGATSTSDPATALRPPSGGTGPPVVADIADTPVAPPPAPSSRPSAFAASRRAQEIADAGNRLKAAMTIGEKAAAKAPPAVPAASAEPAAALRRERDGGGLFERVPF